MSSLKSNWITMMTHISLSLSSSVASIPGAEVPQVARPEGSQTPAGDGGVPPGDSLRPFLCSGEKSNDGIIPKYTEI